jgi:hypothetical protein
MMQEQQEVGIGSDLRRSFNALHILVESHACCLIPFIRHSCGTNVPGIYGVFGLFLMIFAFLASKDIGVLCFMAAWFLAVLCQRTWSLYLYRRGWREHSRYSGWPWLAKLIPFCKTEAQAKSMEPPLCFGIGCLLSPLSPGTGAFIILGGASLLIVRIMQLAVTDRQVTAMLDMELEQRALMERMRKSRNRY